jgi:hypothetical protein
MLKEKLVDGINASGVAEMKSMCKDCIFGKHTTHPFNDSTPANTNVLECIHVDLWGPSPVISAGGAKYFMLLVDDATSFRQVYFLSSKLAEATLNVFKDYHRQVEWQTGKKLK